jgi:hypothetical protein
VDVLVVRLLYRRYYGLGYDGLKCLRMSNHIPEHMMFVKEYVSPLGEMNYIYTLSEICKHSKIGLLISLGP